MPLPKLSLLIVILAFKADRCLTRLGPKAVDASHSSMHPSERIGDFADP